MKLMKLVLVLWMPLTIVGCSMDATKPENMQMSSSGTTTERVTAEYMDRIRLRTPEMVAFMTAFPKGGDLHNHASGTNYIEHGLLFAADQGYFYNPVDKKIFVAGDLQFSPYDSDQQAGCEGKLTKEVKNSSKVIHACVIRVATLINNGVYLNQLLAYLDVASMRGWHQNTSNGQDHFFDTFAHLSIPGWDDPSIALILLRNHQQQIRYVELMIGNVPGEVMTELESRLPEDQFSLANLDAGYRVIEDYLNSQEFSEAVRQFMAKRKNMVEMTLKPYGLTTQGKQPDIVVRYISQMKRLDSPYHSFLQAAAYMKASQIQQDIVATNLVQNESGLPALAHFDAQMQIIDFMWRKLGGQDDGSGGPHIALHAGELVLRESPMEPMRDRISRTMLEGHAKRIGHGVSIAWETDPQQTMAEMRKRDVAVEICLSSNDSILGVKGKDHPLHFYLDAGVPVTLATDDEGVSRSNLSMEYIRAVQEQDLDYAQLKAIARNAIGYSFLAGKGIYGDDGKVDAKYQAYIEQQTVPSIGDSIGEQQDRISTKQYLQIRHEQDLLAFEQKFAH